MTTPGDIGLTCECCGQTDGVTRDGVEGVAVSSVDMLCLYCQPCPDCGLQGGTCWDDPRLGCTTLLEERTARRVAREQGTQPPKDTTP